MKHSLLLQTLTRAPHGHHEPDTETSAAPAIIAFAGISVLTSSWYTVDEGERAVILMQWCRHRHCRTRPALQDTGHRPSCIISADIE
ncbi:MAG: hypothetical protein R3E61_09290 [Pseudomonadales bacterium]